MTYAQLLAQVASWLNRSDLTAVIPDFVTLAEERVNRVLRVRQMEVVLPVTAIVDHLITPPANTLEVKTLWVDGYPGTPLLIQSYESANAMQGEGLSTLFAWKGTDLYFNGTGSVTGLLYQKIPALSAGENWLSTDAPSVYLFGALLEAYLFMGGDATTWQARFDGTLAELQAQNARYNGPLVARAR